MDDEKLWDDLWYIEDDVDAPHVDTAVAFYFPSLLSTLEAVE